MTGYSLMCHPEFNKLVWSLLTRCGRWMRAKREAWTFRHPKGMCMLDKERRLELVLYKQNGKHVLAVREQS